MGIHKTQQAKLLGLRAHFKNDEPIPNREQLCMRERYLSYLKSQVHNQRADKNVGKLKRQTEIFYQLSEREQAASQRDLYANWIWLYKELGDESELQFKTTSIQRAPA